MFIPTAQTLSLPRPIGLYHMCVAPLVIVSLLLGALLHGDMDDNPLFDSLWFLVCIPMVIDRLMGYVKSCKQVIKAKL